MIIRDTPLEPEGVGSRFLESWRLGRALDPWEQLFGHYCRHCDGWMGRSPHRSHPVCTALYCTYGVIMDKGCQTPSYLRDRCRCVHCHPPSGVFDIPPYPEALPIWKRRPIYDWRINGISCGQILLSIVRKFK